MKRIFLIILTVFLNLTFFSCTPDDDEYLPQDAITQDCCGEGEIPPPPPPPPGGGTGG